jgi:Tol biopolymer transport system component
MENSMSGSVCGRAAATMAMVLLVAGGEHAAVRGSASIGVFDDQSVVGVPSTLGPGAASFDATTGTYTIAGGGENMWARADHFRYVWRKMSGDVSLSATIAFTGTQPLATEPNEHRKACLVLRQTLDADSAYVDAATHGNGMTSLQWREAKGELSHDIETNVVGPARLRIEKRGDTVMMFVANPGQPWQPAGGSTRIHFTGDFYVGLGVSSHDVNRIDTATFSSVELGVPVPLGAQPVTVSALETISLGSKDRRVVHVSTLPEPIEAPNWFPDGSNTIYFNRGGGIFKVQADLPRAAPNGSGPRRLVPVDVGGLTRIGHDHVLSRDGQTWAVTDQSQMAGTTRQSLIFTAPAAGGAATRVPVPNPSYVKGFSPDGQTLVYAADRGGNLDIYRVSRTGGAEQRLTTDPGRDDGAEFSADGQFIYFNSDRSGSMQVWRMKADGTAAEQLTRDALANWFPHPSPDGKSLVFLSAAPGATDRLDNTDVSLRRMNLADRAVDELAKLYGGKGTINMASFSPTSQHLAFVSYQRIPGNSPIALDQPAGR